MYFHARALAVEEASLVVPIVATTPTIVIVFSFLILSEWPNLLGRIGIFVMVFGLNYDGLVARRANVSFGLGCVVLIVAAGNKAVERIALQPEARLWPAIARRHLGGVECSDQLLLSRFNRPLCWNA